MNCERGLLCDASKACVGTCQAIPKENEPCVDSTCGPGLQCSAGTCVPKPAGLQRGEACDSNPTTTSCADGLICDDYNGGSNTCQPEAEVYFSHGSGEQCSGDEFCVPGLYCDDVAIQRVCSRVKSEGESCARDGNCAKGLHCSNEQACVPNLPQGGDCYRDAECGEGSCGLGSCGIPKDLGEPCQLREECISDYCENSVCTPIPDCGG